MKTEYCQWKGNNREEMELFLNDHHCLFNRTHLFLNFDADYIHVPLNHYVVKINGVVQRKPVSQIN